MIKIAAILALGVVLFVTFGGYFFSAAKEARELPAGEARYQSIVQGVRNLESRRRAMLAEAAPSGSGFSRPYQGAGAWARGFQAGFSQGYRVGQYLSASRQADPRFFTINAAY